MVIGVLIGTGHGWSRGYGNSIQVISWPVEGRSQSVVLL